MKLVAFTICLDGMPWIEKHLSIFQSLNIPWQWIVVEGASGNTADTSWCQKQKPRLSNDGTHEYLAGIADKCQSGSDRVTHIHKKSFPNKTTMCNVALDRIEQPCVLLQVDCDELWRAEQLEKIHELLNSSLLNHTSLLFACRYYVGPNLVLQGEDCYGDYRHEWLRAWRFNPQQRFATHEPPVLTGDDPRRRMGKTETRQLVGTFEHFAYASEAQVAYKEEFYGYRGAVNQWRALQSYFQSRSEPVSLSRFFPWVRGEQPMVVKI